MESLDSDLLKETTFFSTSEVKNYLMETAKWGKFLAIVGYIGIGLILIAALFMMVAGSAFGSLAGASGLPMGAFGLIYIALAALYFFPTYYLHQFSDKIKRGLNSQDLDDVTAGFENLKSMFKFMGIFTIIILSLYALIFVFGMLAAAMN